MYSSSMSLAVSGALVCDVGSKYDMQSFLDVQHAVLHERVAEQQRARNICIVIDSCRVCTPRGVYDRLERCFIEG